MNLHLEYFSMRLTHSEKNPFAKDIILEWACVNI